MTRYSKLPLDVNICVRMCCRNWLRMHCDPDQDIVVTEDKVRERVTGHFSHPEMMSTLSCHLYSNGRL